MTSHNCPHCGAIHKETCPRIRRIEYFADGQIKAVEFHPPAPSFIADINPGQSAPWKPPFVIGSAVGVVADPNVKAWG